MDARHQEQESVLNARLSKMSDREVYLTFATLIYAVDRARQETLLSHRENISSLECIDLMMTKKLYSKMTSTMAFPISTYGLLADINYEMMYLITLRYAKEHPKSSLASCLNRPFDQVLSRMKAATTVEAFNRDIRLLLAFTQHGKYDYLLFVLLDNDKLSHPLFDLMKTQMVSREELNQCVSLYKERLTSMSSTALSYPFFSNVNKQLSPAKELKEASEPNVLLGGDGVCVKEKMNIKR